MEENYNKKKLSNILSIITSGCIAKLTLGLSLFDSLLIALIIKLYVNEDTVFFSKATLRKEISPIDKHLFDSSCFLVITLLFFLFLRGLFIESDKALFIYNLSIILPIFAFTFISHLILLDKFKNLDKLDNLHLTLFKFTSTKQGKLCTTLFIFYIYLLKNSVVSLDLEYQIPVILFMPIFLFYVLAVFFVEQRECIRPSVLPKN